MPARKLPLHPCICWCRTCTFRDNCFVIATLAIHLGCSNLLGLYLTPSVEECYDYYHHKGYYENFKPNSGQTKTPDKDTPSIQILNSELCRNIYLWYGNLVFYFMVASVSGGAILLVAVFKRVPMLVIVSSVLFGISALLLLGQIKYLSDMSGARFVHGLRMSNINYGIHKRPACEERNGGTGCEASPTLNYDEQLTMIRVGGTVLVVAYVYMSLCAAFYTCHMKQGFDEFTPVYLITLGGGGEAPPPKPVESGNVDGPPPAQEAVPDNVYVEDEVDTKSIKSSKKGKKGKK